MQLKIMLSSLVSMIRKYAVYYLLFKDDKNGTFLCNLDKLQWAWESW